MAQATKTPIDAGIITRAVSGIKSTFNGWFGAGEAMPPLVPEEQKKSVEGRVFDYPTSINMRNKPRANEPISFEQLRALADACDTMRLVIETRKDQLCAQAWSIDFKDEKKPADERCEAIRLFLESPDRDHTWHSWLRMIVEDLLVIDAPTIYPRKTRGGDLYSLDPIDGATIKRIIDDTGRTPIAPEPAYQQILKGIPAANYTRDELIYAPRNPRTHKVYGYSPVEQVIVTVNIALRRTAHQLTYYTDGNTPDLIFQVPEAWNPDQINQFQKHWDLLNSGDSAERHKAKFVPHGVAPFNTKDAALKDEFDEWLARVICFAFSISAQPFVKENNRATAQVSQDSSQSDGLEPLKLWVKALIDRIIVQYFGYTDLQFKWNDKPSAKPLEQAQIDQIYVGAKVVHPNEVRERMGYDPLTPEQKEDMTSSPPPQLGSDEQAQPQKSDEKTGDQGADDANKVVKKKSIKPINRDRSAVTDAVAALTGDISDFLSEQADDLAAQIDALLQ